MQKTLALLALLFIVPATASAQVVKELVGKYRMEVQGGDVLELRDDGSATLAGDETRWSATGNHIRVGSDLMQYTLQGNRLVLTLGPVQLVWKKIGGKGDGQGPAPMQNSPAKAAVPPAPTGNSQDQQARQLLTSSVWCSFTYNKVSGASSSSRVIFRPDGVLAMNRGGETYSSGYGGTYAGQSNSADTMLWKVENLRLYVDQRKGAGFQDANLSAARNSNGAVILHADGREYSMCR